MKEYRLKVKVNVVWREKVATCRIFCHFPGGGEFSHVNLANIQFQTYLKITPSEFHVKFPTFFNILIAEFLKPFNLTLKKKFQFWVERTMEPVEILLLNFWHCRVSISVLKRRNFLIFSENKKLKKKFYVSASSGCRSQSGAGAAAGHVAWLLALVTVSTSSATATVARPWAGWTAEDFCTVHLTRPNQHTKIDQNPVSPIFSLVLKHEGVLIFSFSNISLI